MIFNKLNAGCGYDLKNEEGWLNVDKENRSVKENFRVWNLIDSPTVLEYDLTERFDFILLNHVLCTMSDGLAHLVLINLHRCLKPGGKLHVIDMDLLKIVEYYQNNLKFQIPIAEGDLDDRFCLAISGYGTRDSIYTPQRMHNVLMEAGFRLVVDKKMSEYDSRPLESLIVEATK